MTEKSKTENNPAGDRIAKVIARAGLCSRREAERWISEGRVSVNGDILDSPACVVTDSDKIVVDGKTLPAAEKTRLFLYHKKTGLVTTAKDEFKRKTIYDDLPAGLPRLLTIGRLDLNTEGLLILTNDGGLKRYMELPKTGIKREYRVRVMGNVTADKLKKLKDGMEVEGIQYGSIEAQIEKGTAPKEQSGANIWLVVSLKEGKNREIRRVMEALDLQVNRLIRTSYGTFHLGNMPKGSVLEIPFGRLKDHIPDYFKQAQEGGQQNANPKNTHKSKVKAGARAKPQEKYKKKHQSKNKNQNKNQNKPSAHSKSKAGNKKRPDNRGS